MPIADFSCAPRRRTRVRRHTGKRSTNGIPRSWRAVVADLNPTAVDTAYVRTYYVYMNITLSVDDEVVRIARKRAEAMGTSINQMVREYLEDMAGKSDAEARAEEFSRLSRLSRGDSNGWKWNREEIYERR